MEAIFFSETSVDFQRATRFCMREDSTLHNHRCRNLKSYNIKMDSELEYWTMDKVRNPSDSERYTPSSEPFTIKLDLRKISCKSWRWKHAPRDHIRWWALIVLKQVI
jgi:hypothetical protein